MDSTASLRGAIEAMLFVSDDPVSVARIARVLEEPEPSSLVDKGLVRETGRDRNQGNAIIYGTTRNFLEKFGLKDLTELPPLEEFSPDPQTERAIRERLGAMDGSMLAEDSSDDTTRLSDDDENQSDEVVEFDPENYVTDKVDSSEMGAEAATEPDTENVEAE